MLKLLIKFFSSPFLRFVIRVFASLASAIILVSSYLFFVSNQEKQRELKNGRKVSDEESSLSSSEDEELPEKN